MAKVQSTAVDICVLIPCHNNLTGLIASLQSIVYANDRLLVLIVDDGSSIPVTQGIQDRQWNHAFAIDVLRLDINSGITVALNAGLDYIGTNLNARFVARLDCGDVCDPTRFILQAGFLDNHPDIDLIGTWCKFRNAADGRIYNYRTPTQHNAIKRSMYFRNVFIHPSVMWRFETLQAFRYPQQYPHAEDYGLFYDIVLKKRTAILNHYFVTCEINGTGISLKNRFAQLRSREAVIKDYGTNKWLVLLGVIKLRFLMIVPATWLYRLKLVLFR